MPNIVCLSLYVVLHLNIYGQKIDVIWGNARRRGETNALPVFFLPKGSFCFFFFSYCFEEGWIKIEIFCKPLFLWYKDRTKWKNTFHRTQNRVFLIPTVDCANPSPPPSVVNQVMLMQLKVEVKFKSLCISLRHESGVDVLVHSSLTRTLDGVVRSASRLGLFTPQWRSGQ